MRRRKQLEHYQSLYKRDPVSVEIEDNQLNGKSRTTGASPIPYKKSEASARIKDK